MKQLLFYFLLIIVSTNLNAQEIKELEYGYYAYKGNTYQFWEMEDILNTDELSYSEYRSAISDRKKSAVYTGITIVTFLVGAYLANSAESNYCNYVCDDVAYRTLFWGTSIATGIVAILKRSDYISKRNQVILFFNRGKDIGYQDNTQNLRVGLAFTNNGLGMIFNF